FLVIKSKQSINDRLAGFDKMFYALNDNTADVYCSRYWVVDGGYGFDVSYFGSQITGWHLGIGGFHNIENAIAAIVVAMKLGNAAEQIKEALASFKGIKRRFEKVFESDRIIFIDDYAHHPEEIRVLIESVRE